MFVVGELGATINADRTPFDRTLDSVFTSGARRMQRLGSTMTRALTLPLTAFAGASVKAFADFDQAMTESTAIMSGVTKDVRTEMERAARSVSEDLAISSEKAAESYFFLASAGLNAQQSIQALPAVAKFAQAGMFDMATATDLATDAQSALGLTVEDATQNLINMQRVTDVLVKANTLANASVQQFSESLTNRAAAALRAANKEVEEGVAVLAAFADQGIKGQYAGEQLARILRILSQAASKNRKEFQEMGIIDASGNLNSMADIIESLTNELGGLSDTAKSAKLEQLGFTARVQASIKPLLGTADAIREYEEGLRRAAGITDEVADKQMASLTNQFKVLWNTIVNGGQAIGASLNETFDIKSLVGGFQDSIKTAINWFNSLSQETRKMAFYVAGLLGASGPIIAALGTLSLALGAISTPIAGAVAAVGGGAALLISNWEEVERYFTSGGGAQMWKELRGIVENTAFIISDLWERFGDNIVGFTEKSFSAIAKIVETTLSAINETIAVWRDLYTGNFEKAFVRAESSWRDHMGSLKNIVQTGLLALREIDVLGGYKLWEFLGLIPDQQELNRQYAASMRQALDSARSVSKPEDVIIPADFDVSIPDMDLADKFGMFSGAENPIGMMDTKVKQLSASIGDGLTPQMERFRETSWNALTVGTEGMSLFEIATQGVSDQLTTAQQAGMQFGQMLGNAFSQAALHAKRLDNILLSVVKQLASKALITGLQILLTGGVGSMGFFSTMFGGFRANGGSVFAGNAYRVGEMNQPEMFIPSSNGSIQPMQTSSKGRQKIQLNISGQFVQHGSQLRAVINESQYIDAS